MKRSVKAPEWSPMLAVFGESMIVKLLGLSAGYLLENLTLDFHVANVVYIFFGLLFYNFALFQKIR